MRMTVEELDGEREIDQAIASLSERDCGEYKPFCLTCGYYIYKKKLWTFRWIREYSDHEYRCQHCFPTREAMIIGLRNGLAFRHAAIQLRR